MGLGRLACYSLSPCSLGLSCTLFAMLPIVLVVTVTIGLVFLLTSAMHDRKSNDFNRSPRLTSVVAEAMAIKLTDAIFISLLFRLCCLYSEYLYESENDLSNAPKQFGVGSPGGVLPTELSLAQSRDKPK